MRNEAMEQLDVLVGSWRTTMRNAWFLEPADQKVPGSATVEWLGDAFVVFRWTMGGDVGPATSEMVLVLGRSDAHDAYTALYHDERGVCRVLRHDIRRLALDADSPGPRHVPAVNR